MRNSYQKRKRKEFWQVCALVLTIVIVFAYLPTAFRKADCASALENIAFIDKCKAKEHCRITTREARSYSNWHRLALKTCPITKEVDE